MPWCSRHKTIPLDCRAGRRCLNGQTAGFSLRRQLCVCGRQTMTTLRINHMSLQVRDLARSSDFYQRVLNLPEVECLAARPNIRWFGIGDEHTIHLIEGD